MIKTINAAELKKKIDGKSKFRLIEVLLPDEFNEWHIPGAENIPADDLGEIALEKIKKDEEIIVYCLDIECNASNRAANILEKLGYKNIIKYEGGKADWKNNNYPIEK